MKKDQTPKMKTLKSQFNEIKDARIFEGLTDINLSEDGSKVSFKLQSVPNAGFFLGLLAASGVMSKEQAENYMDIVVDYPAEEFFKHDGVMLSLEAGHVDLDKLYEIVNFAEKANQVAESNEFNRSQPM